MLCHADADIVTYDWRETQPHPYPDFSINRKCRNFNDVLAYRDAHRVSMSKYEAMEKPKDATTIPMESGYYDLVRNTLLTIPFDWLSAKTLLTISS
jgi:Mycotoxin biosynthesis protein UstYa